MKIGDLVIAKKEIVDTAKEMSKAFEILKTAKIANPDIDIAQQLLDLATEELGVLQLSRMAEDYGYPSVSFDTRNPEHVIQTLRLYKKIADVIGVERATFALALPDFQGLTLSKAPRTK